MRVDVEPIDLDASRAVSTGLIINELVTNALKYGFPDGREGEIAVTFRRQEHELCLTVQDDGIGIGQVAGESTGRRLVRALARQLGGHAEWTTDGGTIVTLTFPHVGDEQQVF
jgi:two-component sensor histidine kinase